MIIGYLILAGLAFAFLALGGKGLLAGELPLTRTKKLEGTVATVVGAVCLVLGIGIIAVTIYDIVLIAQPPPVRAPLVQPPTKVPPRDPLGPPEFAENLEGEQVLHGMVSLFDGETTFGWSGAVVKEGRLRGGVTTTRFNGYNVSADVDEPGTFLHKSDPVKAAKGSWFFRRKHGRSTIELKDGLALRHISVMLDMGSAERLFGNGGQMFSDSKHARVIRGPGGAGALEYADPPFGDFVLVAKVRTKDPLAKAAIHIRCIRGELDSGYVIPIYNACEKNDVSKPAIWSTGAIKDHQNARRLVSRDNEFTYITIVAVGQHIATWVNGYQQTDWIDSRPPSDNAREGTRTEAGTIQFVAPKAGADFEVWEFRVLDWSRDLGEPSEHWDKKSKDKGRPK